MGTHGLSLLNLPAVTQAPGVVIEALHNCHQIATECPEKLSGTARRLPAQGRVGSRQWTYLHWQSKTRCMLGLCCRNTAQSFPPSKPSIPPEYEAVKTQINQFLEVQVIRECCSPYTSPIVVVQKKDVSLCMCVDYRRGRMHSPYFCLKKALMCCSILDLTCFLYSFWAL